MSSEALAEMPIESRAVIEFGPFRFDPMRREIVDRNGPIRLGSRALHILQVLLESPGRLYSREELVRKVWPLTVVEDTSLRVHVSALRRVLGDGVNGVRYITNVPGRGYAFVGEYRRKEDEVSAKHAIVVRAAPATESSLPPRLSRVIGRGHDIAQLVELLTRERLVSVVGAGGMGKTTVALSVAEELQAEFQDGAFMVDLSRIADPAFVAVELGQTQGLNIAQGEPSTVIEAALRDKRVLFVVDNCEHVIDAIAGLIDRLMRSCRHVHFLTTSREPLELEAEWVYKLPPLAVPETDDWLNLATFLSYPAIQLFVERAEAISDTFELTEAHAPPVRHLCQFLDGIPLAIELAAARVDSLGIHGLTSRLNDIFELLTRGRRTALSRHRTLQAVLDWSYDLLSDTERTVLQRLSVFRGAFDLDGAAQVLACDALSTQQVIDDVLSLCAKSLVVLEATDGDVVLHRLLYITRLYAEKRLEGGPNAHEVHRRHAVSILAAHKLAHEAGAAMAQYHWTPALGHSFADLRAAIEWALVQEHDLTLGLELTASAKRAYCDNGIVEEYRKHLQTALDKVGRAEAQRERLEMELRTASAFISGYSMDGAERQAPMFARARDLALEVGTTTDRLESLFGICVGFFGQGDYRQTLRLCDEIRTLATGEFEPLTVAICDRFAAMCFHGLGEHDAAEALAHRVMAFHGVPVGRRFLSEVPFSVSMRIQLARIHWLRADFDVAWSTILEALELSADAHVFARCQTLGIAGIPMAIWKGDLHIANQWIHDLLDLSEKKQLPYWQAFARAYRRVIERDEPVWGTGETLVIEKMHQLKDLLATVANAAPSPATLLRAEQGEAGWCAPEVLRRSALEDLKSSGAQQRERAVATLGRALEMATRQGAEFWTLRLALTICSASPGGELEGAAHGALRSVMGAKDNGSSIAELVAARAVLKDHA
jgi:predicted ATPase/DNA-binding winged helix-turn-helix (wHTH) protein